MGITRDRDYPTDRAQLFQTLSHVFEGSDMETVLDVLANALIAGLGFHSRANGLSLDEAKTFARGTCDNIVAGIEKNWERKGRPDDVDVKAN